LEKAKHALELAEVRDGITSNYICWDITLLSCCLLVMSYLYSRCKLMSIAKHN